MATVDMATVLGRYVAGENYFWIFDKAPGEAARIVSLLWAASLRAATETGRIVRTALRMKLAELSANSSDPLLQQLHASLSSSVFTDGLDAFLGGFIAKLGHVSKPGKFMPPFEDAVNAARSEDEWRSSSLSTRSVGPPWEGSCWGCGLGIMVSNEPVSCRVAS